MSIDHFGCDDGRKAVDLVSERLRDHGMNPDDVKDGVVLGTGLKFFADRYLSRKKAGSPSGPVVIPFSEVFGELGVHAQSSTMDKHAKELVIGPLEGDSSGRLVMAQSGREHPYQKGIDTVRATFFLRVMQLMKFETLLGSNASGILTPKTVTVPELIVVSSDIDEGNDNPLFASVAEEFGPIFQHMVDLYPEVTRAAIQAAAMEVLGKELKEGTYVREKGPHFERKTDVYRLRSILKGIWEEGRMQLDEHRFDGDIVGVVGMSTTYEALVAQHAARARGGHFKAFQKGRGWISVATNHSGSCGPDGFVEDSSDEEVGEVAKEVEGSFGEIVVSAIKKMREAA